MKPYTVSGEIQRITTEVLKNGKPKTEVVVDEGGQYPNPIGVEFYAEEQSAWAEDNCEVGGMLEIECRIKGRDWEPPDERPTKNFISLQAFKQEVNAADRDQRTAADDSDGEEPPF